MLIDFDRSTFTSPRPDFIGVLKDISLNRKRKRLVESKAILGLADFLPGVELI